MGRPPHELVDGGRGAQGQDAALRRRPPGAAHLPRGCRAPARVLRRGKTGAVPPRAAAGRGRAVGRRASHPARGRGDGAAVHHRPRRGRRRPGSATPAQAAHWLHGGHPGGGGGQRTRGGGLRAPLPGPARKPRRRDRPVAARPAIGRAGRSAAGERLGQTFRAVLADPPRRSRDRDRAAEGPAASAAHSRAGTPRVHQLRHGELRGQRPDPAPVPRAARRARFRRLERRGDRHPGVPARLGRRPRAHDPLGRGARPAVDRSAWSKALIGTTKP